VLDGLALAVALLVVGAQRGLHQQLGGAQRQRRPHRLALLECKLKLPRRLLHQPVERLVARLLANLGVHHAAFLEAHLTDHLGPEIARVPERRSISRMPASV
jgi:hypothetical protein